MNAINKIHVLLVLVILVTWVFTACTVSTEKMTSQPLRLVIINNTSPDSPYATYPESVQATFTRIQSLNPVFMMHTGNIIHGGYSWMGVRSPDMHAQYKRFYRHAEKLTTLLYTTVGPLDTLNRDVSIYSEHTGYKSYYSFNYGNTHFVVLNSTEKEDTGITDTQYKWLSEDLRESSKCCTIIVFMYHCPLNGNTGRNRDPEPAFQGAEKIHSLLSLYGVKAVFSSDGKSRSSFTHDNITYNQVPCVYPEKNRYRNNNQFYIIDLLEDSLDISGHSIY